MSLIFVSCTKEESVATADGSDCSSINSQSSRFEIGDGSAYAPLKNSSTGIADPLFFKPLKHLVR